MNRRLEHPGKFSYTPLIVTAFLVFCCAGSWANLIPATPTSFKSLVGILKPGDTLYLNAGNYPSPLTLNNLNGTEAMPIVIMGAGNSTVFLGNACCNTISITKCSYLVIKKLKIDGQNINYIDGVKAEGSTGNWAHHITLENLYIVNNGGNITGDNQTVGISTKCSAWNWTIRGCTIIAAGTGLYLGNPDGSAPFVSGVIENNLVIHTKGYNMQVKAQGDNVRDDFPGTSNDYQKTIIRYNVFSKDSGSTPIGVGDGSRPCLLMDNFPSTGYGSHDMYEVYGNFFYNNPTEALLQITANSVVYNNIFVNHVAASGYGAISITNHNGFAPRSIALFHNTILTNATAGGIRLTAPNNAYQQYCYANAVFSNGTPISGFSAANTVDNISDSYANAAKYIQSPSTTLSLLNLYPRTGQLQGSPVSSDLFNTYTDYNIDFNANSYNWSYRGAYAGSGINPGWQLKLDTMPTPHAATTGISAFSEINDAVVRVYPNPVSGSFGLDIQTQENDHAVIRLIDATGGTLQTLYDGMLIAGNNTIAIDTRGMATGLYLLHIHMQNRIIVKKVLIQE